jgi:hypothetical protein
MFNETDNVVNEMPVVSTAFFGVYTAYSFIILMVLSGVLILWWNYHKLNKFKSYFYHLSRGACYMFKANMTLKRAVVVENRIFEEDEVRAACNENQRRIKIVRNDGIVNYVVDDKVSKSVHINFIDFNESKMTVHTQLPGFLSPFLPPGRGSDAMMCARLIRRPLLWCYEQYEAIMREAHTNLRQCNTFFKTWMASCFHTLFTSQVDYFDTVLTRNWINTHIPSKRKVYDQAFTRLLEGFRPGMFNGFAKSITINVFSKKDETLHCEKMPRPIFAVDPEITTRIGPAIDIAATAYKSIMDWMQIGNKWFYGVYASGLDYLELGRILDNLEEKNNSVVVLCAGDDTIGRFINARGEAVYFEADYSKYDTSQSYFVDDEEEGGLLYENLGVLDTLLNNNGSEVVSFLKQMYSSKIRMSANDDSATGISNRRVVEFDFNLSPMFFTGSPNTTFNNTMTNISMWLYWLVNHDLMIEEEVVRWFASKGLVVKLKMATSWSLLSFLKGHFVHGTYTVRGNRQTGFVWTPGLGAVAKFSVCKKIPSSIYGNHKPELKHLYCVARGWQFYPRVPILGVLCDKYTANTNFSYLDERVEFDIYKPVPVDENGLVDLEFKWEAVEFSDYLEQYDLSVEEVHSLEEQIRETGLMELIADPLILKCAAFYL